MQQAREAQAGGRPVGAVHGWLSKAGAREALASIFAQCGVTIDGDQPFDIRIHDERFHRRVLSMGSLGLGESYMDGWWDCTRLDEFFARILRDDIRNKVRRQWPVVRATAVAWLMNLQSPERAYDVGRHHYDAGNDLYRAMLDRRMTYSCGYWRDAYTLDAAQEAKLDLICRKLGLLPGMRVLDIGCGWGSFARFAAERHGVSVVGVTVSREQVTLARELCAGLPVEIRLQDYRQLGARVANELHRFDRVVSIGMMEHVGYRNYAAFFDIAHRCLTEDGLLLLHTIGSRKTDVTTDPWILKYIFPNSMLPSMRQLAQAAEGRFVTEDWHSFGPDYDRTLMAWHANFEAAWPRLAGQYDERFHRMWRYYLLSCAGSFRARRNQLWQIVYSKNGIPGGYTSVR